MDTIASQTDSQRADGAFGLALDQLEAHVYYYGHTYRATVLRVTTRVLVRFRLSSRAVDVERWVSISDKTLVLTRRAANYVTAALTGFDHFDALLTAQGGYRPTIMQDGVYALLANTYDKAQQMRGDARRAYRRPR
jgi:hypothetical protein